MGAPVDSLMADVPLALRSQSCGEATKAGSALRLMVRNADFDNWPKKLVNCKPKWRLKPRRLTGWKTSWAIIIRRGQSGATFECKS